MTQIRIDDGGRRSGLTRVDVAVLLGILALLAAFLAPAIRSTPRSARKLECLNNIRQVGIAMQSFASANNGQLPSLSGEMKFVNRDSKEVKLIAGWPIQILPALDGSKLMKDIKSNAVVETSQIGEAERIYFKGFTCPQDEDSHMKPGGLSYVVNAGFMARGLYHGDPDGLHRLGQLSWDGNDVVGEEADIEVAAATGVFWRKSDVFQPSLDYVGTGDGTTNTLMLSENLQAGNWWDTDTARLSFGIPVETINGRVPFGKGTLFESVERPLNTTFTGDTIAPAQPQEWRINSDLKAATGTRPRPSSNHPGGVNFIFCDGSGKYLSNQIDPHLYAKLLTPNGVKYGEGELPQSAY